MAAANWVTHGILDELAARPDLPPAVAEKVRWCLDAQFYNLDLRDAAPADLAALAAALGGVIQEAEARGPTRFQLPQYFPAFLGKVRELRARLDPEGCRLDGTYLFDYGSEGAPDSPAGLLSLIIQPDGRFRFHQRRRGRVLVERTGALDPEAAEEIAGQLAGAGFPAVPDHERPPGGDDFTVSQGKRVAFMNRTAAGAFPGYGPLIRRVLPWMNYLIDLQGDPPAGLRVDRPREA